MKVQDGVELVELSDVRRELLVEQPLKVVVAAPTFFGSQTQPIQNPDGIGVNYKGGPARRIYQDVVRGFRADAING